MKHKVSDLVAEFLNSKGMTHLFGIIGSGNAHIFDSIYQNKTLEMVCVHHEQAACMAMQTYYRTSGVVTASLVTTGAGSTNAITGVVSAWADSIPGMIISGNENSKHVREDNPLRMYGVQGYDSPFMVSKVTKYAKSVECAENVLYELEKAYFMATQGRPGPVWIDIPMNIQSSLVEEGALLHFKPKETEEYRLAQERAKKLSSSVNKIYEALSRAKRPVIWLGHGIKLAGAEKLLPELLEKIGAAYLLTWAGIDMLDSYHPLVYGRAGVYGQRAANFVLQNADYLLTIGTRLAIPQVGYEISELARDAKISAVDVDINELNKYKERFENIIEADAGDFLQALIAQASGQPFEKPQEWISLCDSFREKFPWLGDEHQDQDGFLNSYRFMEKLHEHLKEDQVIVTDMGTALLSGHQILKIKKGQRLMTSTGLGEMGYGLPGAIGASFARKEGEVMCLNCDGGMMMNLQELQTLAHYQLPLKIFIFNNDGYLMIKHTQKAIAEGRYSGTDKKSGVSCPDFSKLADAFGFASWQIRTWEDFDRVLPQVQAHEGTVICEVFMHPEQPSVPKLSLAIQKDGSLISPPLEDLSPPLPYEELKENMKTPLLSKSEELERPSQ